MPPQPQTAGSPARGAQDGPEREPGREPRWPALVAALAAAGLFASVPVDLAIAPSGVLPAAVGAILLLSLLAYPHGNAGMARWFSFANLGLLTLFLVGTLAALIRTLIGHGEAPEAMLRSAATLWGTNVLIFALWYWRLDAGGPHARDRRRRAREAHTEGAFLFPQMGLSEQERQTLGVPRHWSPQFADYLFLAFNTSTSFAPADTAVLSRWAKVLMMLQASVSLLTVALLAARAVNIL